MTERTADAFVRPIDDDAAAVLHLVRRLLQRHTALWAAVIPDLTKTQWAVLRAVLAEPDNDQNVIGERTAVDKATLVPLVRRLIERGLLVREDHPADGRRRRLVLTEGGEELVARTAPLVREVDLQALAPLRADERAQLRALLTRVV